MQNQLDQIKKISQEDPKLFIDIVDNLVAVIDLLLGIKDMPEVEAKFKHSIELARAEYLLDGELERKCKLAETMLALVFNIVSLGIAFKK